MNRRNFLKSLGKVCGAAVVAPAVLLKAREKSKRTHWIRNKQGKPIKVPWVHYYTEYHYSNDEFAKKMKQAFKDTKFKRPVPYGIPYWIRFGTGDQSKIIFIKPSDVFVKPSDRSDCFYNGIPT